MFGLSRRTASMTIYFPAAVLLLLVMFYLSLILGAADISRTDVWRAVFTRESGETYAIIRDIRLPREVGAAVTGAALAVSGAIMQGMTRNPLAEPGLLGLTAGANLALAVMLAFFPGSNYFGLMLACMAGATIAAAIVFGVNKAARGPVSPFRIVLAGAAVTAFFHAMAEGLGLLFGISKDVSMWTAGGLIGTSWSQLQLISPIILVGLLAAILLSRQLTILNLNEDVATGLGQRTELIKALLFVLVILLAGTAVALVGNMAFIGLMIPHIVRSIVGTDYRMIIPMSAIVGAAFLLFADTAGRTINAPYETPVAALVAILGLPFFLWIVKKGGKNL
ncbi:FecCD family ABC transporter permease [Alkalicoccus daliensis]|uniref:Iron complex transport system permease protein n=1 Tax=Alkalicoccus daliensis TaxID=745820 RepID=A0A1H0HUW2_9BACI|nr:iron ABC transporter permease [Alkalicoccus daliensis]SDO22561.1 iron complex transport system permease protein [Alkalicoccus daliensis]